MNSPSNVQSLLQQSTLLLGAILVQSVSSKSLLLLYLPPSVFSLIMPMSLLTLFAEVKIFQRIQNIPSNQGVTYSTKQNTLLPKNHKNILRRFFYFLQSKMSQSSMYNGTLQPQFAFKTPRKPRSGCVKIDYHQKKHKSKSMCLVWYTKNGPLLRILIKHISNISSA